MNKIYEHFKIVMKHKFYVLKYCTMAGIPVRGLFHDLSKFSITEFSESVKYYNGVKSPIFVAREKKGYSLAAIHHTNNNKHHAEYWYDMFAPEKGPIIPYKYMAEMICDKLAAGVVYSGDKFELSEPLEFFLKVGDEKYLNKKSYDYILEVLTQLKNEGINKTINSKNLKEKYNKICK